MHHQRVLNWSDSPDSLTVGVVGELQLVGESDGHDVIVDSIADEELMVQDVVLNLESEHDRAEDIQIKVTSCPGLEPAGPVNQFVLEAFVVGVFRKARGHGSGVVEEVHFDTVQRRGDPGLGFVFPFNSGYLSFCKCIEG